MIDSDPVQTDSEASSCGGRRDRVEACETGWRRARPCGGDATVFIGPTGPSLIEGGALMGLDYPALIDSDPAPFHSDPSLIDSGPVQTDSEARPWGGRRDRVDACVICWRRARPCGGDVTVLHSDPSLIDSDPSLIDSEARPCGGRRDRVGASETGWRRARPCGGDVTVFIEPKPKRGRRHPGR